MTNPSPAKVDLRSRILDLASRVAALAERAGRPELGRSLRTDTQRMNEGSVSAVVVGEMKRGKSSLVNALLGKPGLSPVDVDVTTNVRLLFRYAAKPYVRVHRADAESAETIASEAIGVWASVAGNPGNEKGAHLVEVGLDHPLLADGLLVIDTPGVGGLVAGHAAVTLAALGQADALLFVLDANAPLSQTELNFLREATSRIATVLFVVTKVDQYRGWRTIVDADRTLLSERVPEFATSEVIPVSSALALQSIDAANDGDDEFANDLRAESGLDALEAALRARVVGRAALLRLTNLLRSVRSTLAVLALPERAAVAAVNGDPELKAALEAEQTKWQEFTRDNATWVTRLNDEVQDLRFAVTTDLSQQTMALKRQFDRLIQEWDADIRSTLPDLITQTMHALFLQFDERLTTGAVGVLERLGTEFGIDLTGGNPYGDGVVETPAGFLERADTNPHTAMDSTTLLSLGGSAFMGFNVVKTVLGAGAASAASGSMELALLSGAAMAGAMFLGRRKSLQQQEAKVLFAQAFGEASVAVRQEIERRLALIQRNLRDELRRLFDARATDIKEALTTFQHLAEADRQTRQSAKANAQRHLQVLDQLEKEVTGLAAALAQATAAIPSKVGANP